MIHNYYHDRAALRTQLRNLSTGAFSKAATLGGEQESGFEQAFANLAFAYMSDKAPRLLDYLVGFQLVDRNDDNTKAMGVFGFKADNQWLYAPVFFLNGDMKGHELLYIKNSDKFVPLKENWINSLLSKRPHVLGKSSPQSASQLGARSPDLNVFSDFPGGTKSGSARLSKEGQDLFKVCLAEWTTRNPMTLEKFAGLDERLDLRNALASDVRLVKTAMQYADRYPLLGYGLEQFYGHDLFRSALGKLQKTAAALPSDSILGPPRAVKPARVKQAGILGYREPLHPIRNGRLKISVQTDAFEGDTVFTEEAKEKILRDGYLVEDMRTGEELSSVYNTQVEVALTNPTDTGLYEVLTKKGQFKRCLIVCNPHSGDGRKNMVVVIGIEDGGYNWVNADSTAVWVKSQESDEDYRNWLDGRSTKETLASKGVYIAISPSGQGSVPFKVYEEVGEKLYDVTYKDYTEYRYGRDNAMPRILSVADRFGHSRNDNLVQLNERKGSSIKSVGGTLYIPEDSFILTLKKPPESSDDGSCCCVSDASSENPPIEPGNLVDLQTFMLQKTAELKVVADHHEYYVNRSKPMGKIAAIVHLVRDHGLPEPTAKLLVQQADRFNGFRCRIKYANPYLTGGQQYSPEFPEPNYTNSPEFGNVPQQMPLEEEQQVNGLSAMDTDPSVYDGRPEAVTDPYAAQTAQQATQTGQKEVFDTAMLGSMLNTVREQSLVDKYMGDLDKALDRLGRLLFLMFWHNEEFTDRYGKADMPELEDTLRNAFEVLGDLLLWLREKSINPDPATLGDPNIQESARN